MTAGSVKDKDGLPLGDAGPWVLDKHALLRRYVDISSGVRAKFVGANGAGATYIDLYCGPGKLRVRESAQLVDGSAIVAALAAQHSGQSFSEIHLADIDADAVQACVARLRERGIQCPIHPHVGPADITAAQIARRLPRRALHVVFLDPFNLGDLPLSVVAAFSKLAHPDVLIHVSAMDLQRNLEQAIDAEEEHQFDVFAPRWREAVDLTDPPHTIRRSIRAHWIKLVRQLGFKVVEEHFTLIRGSRNQPLYWLAFAAKHDKASEFWEKIRDIEPTRQLPF